MISARKKPADPDCASRRHSETALLLFDKAAAAAGLAVVAPFLVVVAAAIALEDGFPVLFWQTRLGRNARPFRLVKFRSMKTGLSGGRITAAEDSRLTRVGRVLRKYKIDELPQLWNVLKGEMSLVGPRPEVPCFVDPTNPAWESVLRVRPGITDLASLAYRNEEEILAKATDTESYYRETVLPAKLALNLEYLRRRSWMLDLRLIVFTLRFSFFPAGFDSNRIRQILYGEESA